MAAKGGRIDFMFLMLYYFLTCELLKIQNTADKIIISKRTLCRIIMIHKDCYDLYLDDADDNTSEAEVQHSI